MRKIFVISFLFLVPFVYAQDEFVPLNIQKAFANGTRSKDGNPGENYKNC